MQVIREFDPWHSRLCTCPSKYSLNIYTGCDHRCIYCYITSYVADAFHVRKKKNFFINLIKDIKRLDKNKIISISNSSDPYPRIEEKLGITRRTLEILAENNVRYQIITKSNIVVRDIDILERSKCCVAMTITTLKENIAKLLEPNAPRPIERIKALEELNRNNVPTVVRIDPIIPYLNEDEIEDIIAKVSFVDHIVASTFKPRYDSWKRFSNTFPDTAEKIRDYYFLKGQKISNSWYLDIDMRFKLLKKVKEIARRYNISFGSCRENFYSLHSCDGSHLIRS